ncbi:hypothetical protein K443DRAFT_285809 [Laccaria amethystina LaAM-08-1]|uniref:GSKIP domain-containing protein n=1 Tax=Laccaria amethystina LaAM-08-1 TaxID=1095629 RepID=A0A0C9XM51_9AGAR|nr:hypothetical protein K443DRAFT_285809 [Laccaria amethystina LaAM-08-1]
MTFNYGFFAHGKMNPTFRQTMSHSTLSFCNAELDRALKEQGFAIHSYAITSSSPRQASASVVLLEGRRLTITLTTQGYSIDNGKLSSRNVYETLENLLQSVSTMYNQRRQEALFAALEKLQ